MSPKPRLIATACVIVTGTATTFAVVGSSAAAGSATQNLHFVMRSKYAIQLNREHFVSASTLRQRHHDTIGRRAGIATFGCAATSPTSGVFICRDSLTLKGGQLIGRVKVDFASGSNTTGVITDGTGDFKNASGTVQFKKLNSHHTIVSVAYSTH